jgi:hypothetical protein
VGIILKVCGFCGILNIPMRVNYEKHDVTFEERTQLTSIQFSTEIYVNAGAQELNEKITNFMPF